VEIFDNQLLIVALT